MEDEFELRDTILDILRTEEVVQFEDEGDLTALADQLTEGIQGGLVEAEDADVEQDERDLSSLYDACQKWSGQPCSVENVKVAGPAVELGAGHYLAMEELEPDKAFPILGYDLPDGRVYHHRFSSDTRVFVLPHGVVVLAHPDLVLSPEGLHEGAESAPATEDLLEEAEDHPDYDPEEGTVEDWNALLRTNFEVLAEDAHGIVQALQAGDSEKAMFLLSRLLHDDEWKYVRDNASPAYTSGLDNYLTAAYSDLDADRLDEAKDLVARAQRLFHKYSVQYGT